MGGSWTNSEADSLLLSARDTNLHVRLSAGDVSLLIRLEGGRLSLPGPTGEGQRSGSGLQKSTLGDFVGRHKSVSKIDNKAADSACRLLRQEGN